MDSANRSLLVLAMLGLLMTSCSAASPLEKLPESMGGLPAGAPPPPATPYQYPAVHDMPPPRSAKPLDDDQQLKLEQDLEAARDRLRREGHDADAAPEPKKKSHKAKKTPAAAAQAGAKTNP